MGFAFWGQLLRVIQASNCVQENARSGLNLNCDPCASGASQALLLLPFVFSCCSTTCLYPRSSLIHAACAARAQGSAGGAREQTPPWGSSSRREPRPHHLYGAGGVPGAELHPQNNDSHSPLLGLRHLRCGCQRPPRAGAWSLVPWLPTGSRAGHNDPPWAPQPLLLSLAPVPALLHGN